jgi:uncharacterized SAM-binding protein YcdF (DUF218 family)
MIWILGISYFIYKEMFRKITTLSPTPIPTLIPTVLPTVLLPISTKSIYTTSDFNFENILIVLGNEPLDDSTPTIDTMKRVDAAGIFYNRQSNKEKTIVIFTGGPTAGKKTEASVMADYAIKKYNIPINNIIKEEKARSTQENAVLVAKILENKNIKSEKIFIVSKNDHLGNNNIINIIIAIIDFMIVIFIIIFIRLGLTII